MDSSILRKLVSNFVTSRSKMNVSDRIDFSQINFPENLIWNRRPGWEVAVKVTCFIPVILIGSFGNSFTLSFIVFKTNFQKRRWWEHR